MGGFTNEPVGGGQQFNRPMQFTDLPMQVQEQIAVQMSGSNDPQRISLTLSMIQADPAIGEQAMRLLPTAGAGQPSSFSQMPPQLPQQAPPQAFQPPQNVFAGEPRDYNQQLPPLSDNPPMGGEFGGDQFGVGDAIKTGGTLAAAAGAGYGGKKLLDANAAKNQPPTPQARPSPIPSRGRNVMMQGQTDLPLPKPAPVAVPGQMDLPFPGDETVDSLKPPSQRANNPNTAKATPIGKGAKRSGKPYPNDGVEDQIYKQIVDGEKPAKPLKKAKAVGKTTKAWSDTPKDFAIVDIQGSDKTYYHRKDSKGVDRYYVKNKDGKMTHVGDSVEQVKKHASKGATEKTKVTKKAAPVVKEKALTSKKQVSKKASPAMRKKQVKKSRKAGGITKAKNVQSKDAAKAVETAAKKDYLTAPERAKATKFKHGGYEYHAKETPEGIKIYRKNGQLAGASVQKRAMKAATSAVGATKVTGTKQQANAIRKARPNPTKAQQVEAAKASVKGKNAAKAAANAKKKAAAAAKRAAAKALK